MVKTKSTIEEAQRKIYFVKGKNLYVPECLIGKKVRIILDENENKWLLKVKELQKEVDKLREELKLVKGIDELK